jgi:hypothetical protein
MEVVNAAKLLDEAALYKSLPVKMSGYKPAFDNNYDWKLLHFSFD